MTSTVERARGALLGLALGDAVGYPAMYHRTIRLPHQRAALWQLSAEMDRQQVNKFSLPFSPYSAETMRMSGTDDTEFAALTALILLGCPDDLDRDDLLVGWRRGVVEHQADIWSGVAERASVHNMASGLLPPMSGSDNPHHYDDGAVARAVPIGIAYADDPGRAAEVAGWMAELTNAEDGVWAAQAMAASVAEAVVGAEVEQILAAGSDLIPRDSWLGRTMQRAERILEESGSGLAAVPAWAEQCSNTTYNFGNVAPETLAVAYAIVRASGGDLERGLALATMIPKQADSMPAMVGALCGARAGGGAIPTSWVERLDTLSGHCIPHLSGTSLTELADRLVARRAAPRL